MREGVLYKSELLNSDGTTGESGFAVSYSLWGKGTTWDLMVDSGARSTVWKIKSVKASGDAVPAMQINSVTGVIADGSPSFASNEVITAADKVKIENESHLVTAFDLSSAGTSMYGNWSGLMRLTFINTTPVNTASWHPNNGLATDMLGNVETTSNGDKMTVTMAMPAAGCTLVGEGSSSDKVGFNRLTFTGFDKCQFDPANGANWTSIEYYNSERLAKAKEGTLGYATTFKDESGAEMLLVGFPELDGVLLVMNKSQ